jgi:rSAM/selenodomain-associated transferase 2
MDHSRNECPEPVLSIVIPTLDEASQLATTLDAVGRLRDPEVEVIIVDGGSHDDTVAIAEHHGARIVTTARGRGAQLHAGACTARGRTLWFLHADTWPPTDAVRRIAEALADPAVVGGNFEILFSGNSRPDRFLNWLYPRLRWLGLSYGDSAYFMRRSAYEQIGGFRPYPIFEDLDLLRRLRRIGRFVSVPSAVVTSSRNFEGRRFTPVFARWVVLQVLYWLGVPPGRLGRYYGRRPVPEDHAPGSSPPR